MGTYINVKKCGSKEYYSSAEGIMMKIYCATCNAFICNTTYKQHMKIYRTLDETKLSDEMARKRIFERSGILQFHCGKCNCLLYSSWQPKILGQFDLANAKYCPRCGRKLIG